MARPAVKRGVNVSLVLVDVIVVDLCMRVVFRERTPNLVSCRGFRRCEAHYVGT